MNLQYTKNKGYWKD